MIGRGTTRSSGARGSVRYAPLVALLALGCALRRDPTAPRVGLAVSAIPGFGLEGSASGRLVQRGRWFYAPEVHVDYQFLDEEAFFPDGNPASGDWWQAGAGVLVVGDPEARTHWNGRVTLEWMNAGENPNYVQEPGDYLGIRFAIGFETEIRPGITVGPDFSFTPAYGVSRNQFVVVPQVTWGFSWRP